MPDRLQELFESALEKNPEQRDQFLERECAGDMELLAELRSLLDSDQQARSALFWQGSAVDAQVLGGAGGSDPRVGQQIGPYCILRVISSGGMGTVYLAVRADSAYQKHVAIKVIKRGMDTELIVQRFRNERQILAHLEHPNIARLLDGGTTSDGLPYLVMEFVEGAPLDEYAGANHLGIPERLELFRAVCSAVQYAHQNLVIHRDLKPSNILVTREGVPKLLDFGIAKLLSAETSGGREATLTMTPFMTPEYASPEQVRGEPITTVSDVYALGVLLFKLLTGARPYRLKSRRPEDVAAAVCTQEPERPSTILRRGGPGRSETTRRRRSLRGDLDNIVLMAIRKEPERRYPSVEQFSDDIRRYLEGLPVQAHRDTLGYRAGKFVRRNAMAVAASALIVLCLLAGIVGTAWQAHVAREERARAVRRFNDVRKLADSFIFEFHDAIENIPGTLAARQLILKRGLEYLDSLVQESSGDKDLQKELAAAYDRVGILTWDVRASLDAHKKAVAIGESLVRAEPNNHDYAQQLAASYSLVADCLRDKGDSPGALENYRHSMEILLPLAAAEPANPHYRGDLADRYELIGIVLGQQGHTDQALEYDYKSMRLREELVKTDSRNWEHRQALMTLYFFIGKALADNGDPKRGLDTLITGRRLAQELYAKEPSNVVYQRNLWSTNFRIAEMQAAMGDPAAALGTFQTARGYIEKLSKADPGDKGHRHALSITYVAIARTLGELKKTRAALDYCDRARKISEALLVGDPNKAETRADLASIYTTFGVLYLDSADFAKSEQYLERARELAEQRAKADPNNADAQIARARVYADLGDLKRRRNRWDEARGWYQRALDAWLVMRQNGLLRRADAAKPEELARAIQKIPAVK